MEKRKHIFWEILLLIASVFVFRGAWILMDTYSLFNTIEILWLSVIIGCILFGIALSRIVHADRKFMKH